MLLAENGEVLDESNECVDLINAMAQVVELDYNERALSSLQSQLFIFWSRFLLQQKMDIFFFGRKSNATRFFSVIDRTRLNNLYFIATCPSEAVDNRTALQQLKHSPHPLVVYDHDAADIKNSDEVCGAVALIDFQQFMVLQGLPLFDSQDALVSFLQHQHHQVMSKKPQTLIIGNSYGYYAFPQSELKKAVNVSMHSLDLRQAQAMMYHYCQNKKTKHIILMSGWFDIFYELYKTRMPENIHILNILAHYNHNNHILPLNAVNHPSLDTDDEALLGRFVAPIRDGEKRLDNCQALNDKAMQHQISDAVEKRLRLADFPDENTFVHMAVARAGLHSKLYKYQQSKEVNLRILGEMCKFASDNGLRIHYVIPPFPQEYLRALEPQMIKEAKAALKAREAYHFTLYDLHDDKTFTRSDFRDGDHLNYRGALKVMKTLKKRGLVL